jgi:hypothetical protein
LEGILRDGLLLQPLLLLPDHPAAAPWGEQWAWWRTPGAAQACSRSSGPLMEPGMLCLRRAAAGVLSRVGWLAALGAPQSS